MKSVLLSVRPQHVANILNGIKTLEIRKKFPKDYVGWVYIYCTAEDKNGYLIRNRSTKKCEFTYNGFVKSVCWSANRKVVARFWCDKVEEHRPFFHWCIEKETCLTRDDVLDYLDSKDKFVGNPKRQDKVYAIHITNLVPFDKPKEIKEFYTTRLDQDIIKLFDNSIQLENGTWVKPLTRAPESWQYIEVDEC